MNRWIKDKGLRECNEIITLIRREVHRELLRLALLQYTWNDKAHGKVAMRVIDSLIDKQQTIIDKQ